ncbi:hypothetical protein EAI_13133 [Harpegnathos saltator]|uniref:Uncharacterized protein n=1 Tax=Harpegnathos saltator TaxID=610380 RepID=E2BRS6_HARSA|nr:hypothetical protein EAI_13133 [Harpegnathos saltator]
MMILGGVQGEAWISSVLFFRSFPRSYFILLFSAWSSRSSCSFSSSISFWTAEDTDDFSTAPSFAISVVRCLRSLKGVVQAHKGTLKDVGPLGYLANHTENFVDLKKQAQSSRPPSRSAGSLRLSGPSQQVWSP